MLNKFCIMYESDWCFALIAKSSFKLFSQLIPTSVSNPTEDYTAMVLRCQCLNTVHIHHRHLWNYRTYTITLDHTRCTQTDDHFKTNACQDKDGPKDRQGVVNKIKCCDCQTTYIRETGRNLSTRLTEHKRATTNGDVNNHIAEHHFNT